MVQILQVKYVEGLRSFQRESIFCSKISSGGSLFIEKFVLGGINFGGGGGERHFYHDRTLLALNPGFNFCSGFCLTANFSPKDKIRNESLGLRL